MHSLEEKDPFLKNNPTLFRKLKLRGVLFVQTLHLGTTRNGNPAGSGFPVINFHGIITGLSAESGSSANPHKCAVRLIDIIC